MPWDLESKPEMQSSDAVPLVVQIMRWLAEAFGAIAVLASVFVLLGWTLSVPWMVSIIPGLVAMNPVVAVLLMGCGVSLWIQVKGSPRLYRGAKLAGLAIAIIASIKLIGFLIGRDLFVDQILFHHRLGLVPGLPANRMAPNSALAIVLLGAALFLLDIEISPGKRPSEWLAGMAGLVALLGLVGYLYNISSLYHVRTFIPMALHAAAVVDLLSLGILFSRPTRGMMATVTSKTVGGETARKLLPATVLVPILLGWLRVLAEHAGLKDVQFGVTLVILGDIFFFVLLIWSTAGLLRRADDRRHIIEVKLSKERNLLRSLIDNVPDSIFIKDATGRYITCNLAHAHFAGLAGPEDIVGKTVFDLHSAEVARVYNEYDHLVMDKGETLLGREEYLTDSHGQPQWAMVSKIPLVDKGVCSGLVGITRDITAQKKAELERQKAEDQLKEQNVKLQAMAESERKAHVELKIAQGQMVQAEKLAALGQLVAGVAHEINNPLSFVSNNIAVLQRDVKALRSLLELYQKGDATLLAAMPDLMADITDLCERMDLAYTLSNLGEMMVRSRDGLKRIQQIVKDLRDFARLDESDLHEVDLNQGVESTVNIVRGRAKSKQVTIALNLKPLPAVACFPAKINQVIMNLVVNAIDACPQKGTVTINTAPTETGIRIDVVDNGSGIDPKVLERIFDPFFTTKPQGEGTGLGLSISYGIIRDHQGTIEVKSAVGQGSTFSIKLPLRAAVLKKA